MSGGGPALAEESAKQEATPAPSGPTSAEGSASRPKAPRLRRRLERGEWLALALFLLLSQSLLVLAVYLPDWWAAVPVLSAWGVVGWRTRWYLSLLLGGLAGGLYWGVLLLLLPAIPRLRLATVLAGALGLSSAVVLLLGPLLFAVLCALGAVSWTAALRLWDDVRVPADEVVARPPERSPAEPVS